MGLDNLASHSPDEVVITGDEEQAFLLAGVSVCGSITSDGTTSIRGKVYADLVWRVTGISLHEPWLPPERVAAISRRIDDYSSTELADLWDELEPIGGGYSHDEDETAGLAAFFRVCAAHELGLIGWS